MNYIDNETFYQEICKYQQNLKKDPQAVANDYLGKCILKLCNNYTFHKRFIGYTQQWKEEMIFLAIEDCVKSLKKFDVNKSNNPFAYFTRAIHNAFFRVIAKEKEQVYLKHKLIQKMNIDVPIDDLGGISENIIKDYENMIENKKEKNNKKQTKKGSKK